MIPLYTQCLIILHCYLIGLFLGITYDSISIILKNKKIIVRYLIEIIYWFLITFITIRYIINNINYAIRLYTIIFFIIGIISYYYLLAKPHRIRLYFLIYLIKNKINPILKNTLLPTSLFVFIKNLLKKIKKKILIKKKRKA